LGTADGAEATHSAEMALIAGDVAVDRHLLRFGVAAKNQEPLAD
jgi:hypothetical protein